MPTRLRSKYAYTSTAMGYKYHEDEILAAAVESVLEQGLSALTFGRLAKRIGIGDRAIVYYFPTKSALITRTVTEPAGQLQGLLIEAFGPGRLSKDELVRRAWPVLASPSADPVFSVFFELVGLAAAAVQPFDVLAQTVMQSWVEWLVPHVEAPENEARAVAYATVATLDGLLLLRHTLGPRIANLAAQELSRPLDEDVGCHVLLSGSEPPPGPPRTARRTKQ